MDVWQLSQSVTRADQPRYALCIYGDVIQAASTVIVMPYKVEIWELQALHAVPSLGEAAIVSGAEGPHPIYGRAVAGC